MRGIVYGTIVGVIKGDTRSLDYSSVGNEGIYRIGDYIPLFPTNHQ